MEFWKCQSTGTLPGFFTGFDKFQLWNDLVTSGQHPDLNDHSSTIISSLIDIIQWKFWQVLLDFQKGGIPLVPPTYEWDSGADPGFQVGGAHLQKLRRSEEGAKFFGVFREISISYLRTRHQTSYWNEWMNCILINQIHIATEMLTVTH